MKTLVGNNMYWLVKREFWEHRGGFFWAPLVTGGIFLLLNIMGIITAEVIGARHGIHIGELGAARQHFAGGNLQSVISQMDAGDMSQVGMALDMAMYSSMALILVVLGFVVFFYCLGAIYDERRDRSILFWKSLPLSDTETVLSKVVSATLVAPVIATLAGIAAGILQLLIVATTLSFHGINVWQLLMLAHPVRVTLNMIGQIPLYLLWALPSVGWLMACSAWARTKPFLWAIALPVATGLLVTWFGIMGLFNLSAGWFWQNIVARALFSAFPGASLIASDGVIHTGNNNLDFMNLGNTYQLLGSVNLWIGVAAGAALIAAAIWFRRQRDEG
ncbi:ABC-2 transporter permease [Frateuria edaphi]|jgi:ABC-2 type transport system permease protein|uniref:ABC-2 transporter permease n=1 Tax=Frateuria TaxID=70411 RepID=UPI001E3345CF|nr:ABC-2 transporter permease [Frateuria edaphi]UGB46900.1 ABC-2 transporter permease [Frateuria edaphi]